MGYGTVGFIVASQLFMLLLSLLSFCYIRKLRIDSKVEPSTSACQGVHADLWQFQCST